MEFMMLAIIVIAAGAGVRVAGPSFGKAGNMKLLGYGLMLGGVALAGLNTVVVIGGGRGRCEALPRPCGPASARPGSPRHQPARLGREDVDQGAELSPGQRCREHRGADERADERRARGVPPLPDRSGALGRPVRPHRLGRADQEEHRPERDQKRCPGRRGHQVHQPDLPHPTAGRSPTPWRRPFRKRRATASRSSRSS